MSTLYALNRGRGIVRRTALILLALLFCAYGAQTNAQLEPRREPVSRMAPQGLPVSTPQEQGMDSELLAEAVDLDWWQPSPPFTITGVAADRKTRMRPEDIV